jgi:hypothetical protein
VTFGNVKKNAYDLVVNGESKGTKPKAELQKGITIAL